MLVLLGLELALLSRTSAAITLRHDYVVGLQLHISGQFLRAALMGNPAPLQNAAAHGLTHPADTDESDLHGIFSFMNSAHADNPCALQPY